MFNISIDVNGVNRNLLKGALQSFFFKFLVKIQKGSAYSQHCSPNCIAYMLEG